MALWIDKYRPETFKKLTFHHDLNDQLKQLASHPDIPHLLFYGPSGAGKRTRMTALIREIFGQASEKIKIDVKHFTTPSGKKLQLNVLSSIYHLEMNPSDVGMHDRLVVQDVIKEIAQTQQIDSNAPRAFKVLVINEAHSLTLDAQHALRRTMEKYTSNLRLIFLCDSISKIIAPIRSRCLLLRVPCPSKNEIESVLKVVCQKEVIKYNENVVRQIIDNSNGSMRTALLMLECERMKQCPFSDDQIVGKYDWQEFIEQLARSILEDQTPARILQIRSKFYELLTHCIPPQIIIKHLTFELLKLVDEPVKLELSEANKFKAHRIGQGSKAIYHLEGFVAKFMVFYRDYLVKLGF